MKSDRPGGLVDRRCKVCMVTARFHPAIGGSEAQVQRVSAALTSLGWPVSVITRRHWPEPHAPLRSQAFVDGVPLTRVWSKGPGKIGSLLYLWSALWHIFRRGRAQVYHAHDSGTSAWIAIIASRLWRGRSIVKLRAGRRGYERRFASPMARWNLSLVLRLAHRVVVVSREMEAYLVEIGVEGRKVVFVPNGIDTNMYMPRSEAQREDARRRLGISADEAVAVWVGRVERVKGLDVLLRAWALLPEPIRRESRLVVVGEGAALKELRDMTKHLRLEECVKFIGTARDVRPYYWSADVFVLPSRSEGMSNALLEAMACGLPAIASNVGGAPDMVADEVNGFLFQSECHEQLADRLCAFLTNPDQWRAMGTQARDRAIHAADVSESVRILQGKYQELGAP